MIGAGTLRLLVGAGLSSQQILAVAEAIEADAQPQHRPKDPPKDPRAAERQARRRQRLKAAEGDATESGVTDSVTSGVTPEITPAVTRDGVSGAPLDEKLSNPPVQTQTPDGVSPLPARKRRAGRLPDDFAMPDDWKLWAKAQRGWGAETLATEAENFADYWQARAVGAVKRDWRKAWQNWVRNSNRPDGPFRDFGPARTPIERAQQQAEYADRLKRIGRAEDAAAIRRRWAEHPKREGSD